MRKGATQWLPLGCKDFLPNIDLILSLNWYLVWYYEEVHGLFSYLGYPTWQRWQSVWYVEAFLCFIIPHCLVLCGHVYSIDFLGKLMQIPLVFDLMNWYVFWRSLLSVSGCWIKRLLKCHLLWFLYNIILTIIGKTVIIAFNDCLLGARHCLNSSWAWSHLVLPARWVLVASPFYDLEAVGRAKI